ncbi:MAG: hypothetical protein ABJG41_06845 [Cyclobacteriaceae bacterium]
MRIKSLLLLTGILFTFLFACDEQQSISATQVNTYEPAANAIYTKNIVDFGWEGVANANFYTLLVSNPETNQLIIDTSMYSRSYKLYLEPGTYLWQVEAVNNISATASKMRTLTVDPQWEDSMAWDGPIEVVSPADSITVYLNTKINIRWEHLDEVGSYHVSVVSPSFGGVTQEIHTASTYPGINFTEFHLDTAILSIPSTLQWQVWATKSINVNEVRRKVYSPTTQGTLFVEEE